MNTAGRVLVGVLFILVVVACAACVWGCRVIVVDCP